MSTFTSPVNGLSANVKLGGACKPCVYLVSHRRNNNIFMLVTPLSMFMLPLRRLLLLLTGLLTRTT